MKIGEVLLSRQCRIIGILALAIIVLVFALQRLHTSMTLSRTLARESARFISQINYLGVTLKKDESSDIRIEGNGMDELVLLSPCLSEDEISRRFSNYPSATLNKLKSLSWSSREAPVILWIKQQNIISWNYADFSVGIDLGMHKWKASHCFDIQAVQQEIGPHAFLSLKLLD